MILFVVGAIMAGLDVYETIPVVGLGRMLGVKPEYSSHSVVSYLDGSRGLSRSLLFLLDLLDCRQSAGPTHGTLLSIMQRSHVLAMNGVMIALDLGV